MISSSIKQHIVTAPNVSNNRDRNNGTGRSGIETFLFIFFLTRKDEKKKVKEDVSFEEVADG